LSKSIETTLICSKCKKLSQITIWESINVNLDPWLKQKVIDGSLFIVSCPHCSARQIVKSPVLYHDPMYKFMAWWFPKDDEGNQKYNLDQLNMFIPMTPRYKLRIVSSLNELREKIFIFEHELDDRATEILKSDIWNTLLEKRGVKKNSMYFSTAYTESGEQTIEFMYFDPDGNSRVICARGKNGYSRAIDLLLSMNVPVDETPHWEIINSSFWSMVQKTRDEGVKIEVEKKELSVP
jgi:hypothetical protein